MTGNQLLFEIGLLGPSRVGKTSLISSIFRDGQRLLASSAVTIRANDRPTEVKMAQHARALDQLLQSGRFTPGALAPNHETVSFELLLDPGGDADGPSDQGVALRMLDFPGGWLDPANRPLTSEGDWKAVEEFILRSSVLIIPVDATVLVEAVTDPQRGAVPLLLDTYDVAQVARQWARGRAANADAPALALFVPVKCESYFADNGGRRDRSDELYDRFKTVYLDVLNAIEEEAGGDVEVLYTPVDTLGCVERVSGTWVPDADTHLRFDGRFMVRGRPTLSIVGVEDVLIALCRTLLAARKSAEEARARALAVQAQDAGRIAERDRGLVGNTFRTVDRALAGMYGDEQFRGFLDRRQALLQGLGLRRLGEYTRESGQAKALDAGHRRALEQLQALNEVVEDFARRQYSKRVCTP
ncbi:hypothetical protein ABZ816_02270 [Actinosynnema sp. NPDC047251]|uniref:Uncharacterized protein n=1 Tax=Saccharothrix espanaensis (strain ATCC 51144 / DSM 44229 / JCM 9112 / NBRC 15066 / NRRL 15764) TaxID=1179773 RepID=K0K0N0_SACES|nr:hypothetical protein [Saccharothrix espanaensis]CCH31077.1 hypothetical protein BN6_37860 [Saccharothrix espanaensis DSM 44229]